MQGQVQDQVQVQVRTWSRTRRRTQCRARLRTRCRTRFRTRCRTRCRVAAHTGVGHTTTQLITLVELQALVQVLLHRTHEQKVPAGGAL